MDVARCRCGMPLPSREDLPVAPSRERVRQGDPTDLSRKEREAGHRMVIQEMPDRLKRLTIASGVVADHRRLVAFVYLLLNSNMTLGTMDAIMRQREELTEATRAGLFGGNWEQPVGIWTYLSRLVDVDSIGSRDAIIDWLALVFHVSEKPSQIHELVEALPETDDTETVFTNGWLAKYAQYVVKELEDAGT